jgi:hypothetical protein
VGPHRPEPLWEVAPPPREPLARLSQPLSQPFSAPAPDPVPPERSSVVASAARSLADIGVTERDEATLRMVAERIHEIMPGGRDEG